MPQIPKALFQRLLPADLYIPSNLSRRILAKLGYFRMRTWLAAHGTPVPDANLYLPTYSPWEGDPTFERFYRPAQPFTLVSPERCYVLWRTLQQALRLNGDIVECGVFRGGTAMIAAQTIHESGRERPLRLFDSFEGFPDSHEGVDRFQGGDLSNTSLDAVSARLAPYPFVRFHIGFIPDSFAGLPIKQIAWAHVDVDLYQSVRDCIEYIYPRLAPGGFLIFDDYGFPTCPGARRAVDETFAKLPEVPLVLPTGQCMVVKLGP